MVIIVNLLKLMQPLCKVYTRLLLPQSCKFDSWPVRARGELEHGTCHHLSWIFQYMPRLHDSKSDISRINNVQTVTCIICWSSTSGFICQARCFLSLFLPKPNNPTPNPETNPKTEPRPNPKHNQIQYKTQSQAQKQTQMFLARGTAIAQVFYYAGRFSAMPLLAYVALQCTQWWSRWMRKANHFRFAPTHTGSEQERTCFNVQLSSIVIKGICHICQLGICNPCPDTERITRFRVYSACPSDWQITFLTRPNAFKLQPKIINNLLLCSSSFNEHRGRLPA